MGEFKKFFIPSFLLAMTFVIYQNCGSNQYQGNGDPYEDGSIGLPDTQYDDRDTSLATTCTNNTTGEISTLSLIEDQNLSKQTLSLALSSGRVIMYNWTPDSDNLLSVNQTIKTNTNLISVQLLQDMTALVVLSKNGVLSTEHFTCN